MRRTTRLGILTASALTLGALAAPAAAADTNEAPDLNDQAPCEANGPAVIPVNLCDNQTTASVTDNAFGILGGLGLS